MAGDMFMAKRFWIFLAIFVVALTFGLILFVPAVSPKIDDQFPYGMEYDAARDRLYCEVEIVPATKYRIKSCTFVATVRDRYGNVIDERELTTNSSIRWSIDEIKEMPASLNIEIIRVRTNNTFDLILSIILICGAGVALWLAIQSKRKERKEIEDAWREKYKKEPEQ